jgi:hypothetical protein
VTPTAVAIARVGDGDRLSAPRRSPDRPASTTSSQALPRVTESLTSAGCDAEFILIEGADHVFFGHSDIYSIIDRSVDFLVGQLYDACGVP